MLTFLYIVLGKLMLLITLKSQTLTLRQRERSLRAARATAQGCSEVRRETSTRVLLRPAQPQTRGQPRARRRSARCPCCRPRLTDRRSRARRARRRDCLVAAAGTGAAGERGRARSREQTRPRQRTRPQRPESRAASTPCRPPWRRTTRRTPTTATPAALTRTTSTRPREATTATRGLRQRSHQLKIMLLTMLRSQTVKRRQTQRSHQLKLNQR